MPGELAYAYENRVGCVLLRLQVLRAGVGKVGLKGSDQGEGRGEPLWNDRKRSGELGRLFRPRLRP